MQLRTRTVTEDCGPSSLPGACSCREAVTRAFRGMTVSGALPSVALEAATRVFSYHHPSADYMHARRTVEQWVRHSLAH